MNKPRWLPYTHAIDGWGLQAQSAHYRAMIRRALVGEWEWLIEGHNGEHVQDGRSGSITDALNAAETAWEAIHHVL